MIPAWKLDRMSLNEVIEAIVALNGYLDRTWTGNGGWGSQEVAEILDRSRLDWQVSLSECLRAWAVDPVNNPLSDGQLILAWANLGALIEGTLKLFLSLYYNDYDKDPEAPWQRGKRAEPDELMFENLRQFCKKKGVFRNGAWDPYLCSVQQKRNAIHAFRAKDIGTTEDLHTAIRQYFAFLQEVSTSLPEEPPHPSEW